MAHYHTIISCRGYSVYGGILLLDEDVLLKQRILGKISLPKTIRKSKIVKELWTTEDRRKQIGVCKSFAYRLRDRIKDGDILSGDYAKLIKNNPLIRFEFRQYITYDVRLM